MQDNYNRGGFIAFIASVAFSLVFMAWVSFQKGIDLKEVQDVVPGESPVQQTQAQADVDVSKVAQPWASSDDMIAHGKKVFSTNCAMCHGPAGKGDGPAGASLNPKPRDLVEGKWKQGGSSVDLFKTLQTGIPGSSMVSFSGIPAVDRWSLVHFIRSITQNKVADNPKKVEEFAKSAK